MSDDNINGSISNIPLDQQGGQTPVQGDPQASSDLTPPPADPLLTQKVHPDDLDARWTSWKCMVCNFVYEGQRPKNVCPRCGNSDPDKFD